MIKNLKELSLGHNYDKGLSNMIKGTVQEFFTESAGTYYIGLM